MRYAPVPPETLLTLTLPFFAKGHLHSPSEADAKEHVRCAFPWRSWR